MHAKSSVVFAFTLISFVLGSVPAPSRTLQGPYRNPALGYSVKVPRGLQGIAGDEAGPERGVKISLPSGGKIVVFGEPNALEWRTPAEGVKEEFASERCPHYSVTISPVRMSSLKAAQGRLVCGMQVVKLILAFRPGGGPIYWLRLDTDSSHEPGDTKLFREVAASFKLTPWR
jgi:hypothetical protein